MRVELLSSTPLSVLVKAIRTCWDSFDKSDNLGQKDLDLIDRVCNKYKHESTCEHIVFSFNIEGISRLCLQELARHRMASLSVKSTRYTLKQLAKEKPFWSFLDETPVLGAISRSRKYINYPSGKESSYDEINPQLVQLEILRAQLLNIKNSDKAKYYLPESYKTNLVWTINARSLKNFLNLRLSRSAHYEIRELAKEILNIINNTEYKILFKDVKNETAIQESAV